MTSRQDGGTPHSASAQGPGASVLGPWGVRYQIQDVQRAIAFYTQMLGFKLDMQHLPAFG